MEHELKILFIIAVEKLKARSVFLKMKESFSRHLAGQGEMKVIGDDHGFDPSCQTGPQFPALVSHDMIPMTG